jgi:sugar phosphate isomerase/epimerase
MKNFFSFLLLSTCCVFVLHAQVPTSLGVQLYTFRNEAKADLPGMLKMVKGMGIQSVETGLFGNKTAEETKKMLDEYGLKAVSTGAGYKELSDPAKLSTIIQNAKILGSEFVMCAWIDHDGDKFTIEDMKKATEVFNTAGKVLSKAGVKLLYHPHGFEFRPYEDGVLLDYLIKNTNPKYFNLEMDIYWVKNPGQDPVAWLKKYPTRWKTLHVKDQKKGTPGNENGHSDVEWNMVVGEGNQDMPAVMAQAKKIGIKYYFIEDESSRSVEQTPKSIAYLTPFLVKK